MSAAGHDHELSVCLSPGTSSRDSGGSEESETCGQFLFLLPEPDNLGTLGQPLLLTDMRQFEDNENILVYVPLNHHVINSSDLTVDVLKVF